MLLGEKIKQLRKKEDITQEILARKTGISKTTISNTERGFFTMLGPEAMKRIATALNTTTGYLENKMEEQVWKEEKKKLER